MSLDVVIAQRLLDHSKLDGFQFRRTAPGEDGPLLGHRVSGDSVDIIHIAGFSRDCLAIRQRTSPLIIPEDARVERRMDGSALDMPKDLLVHTHRHGYHTPRRAGAHPHQRRL